MKTALVAVLTFPYRVLRWMMLTRPIRFTRFGTFYVLFCLGVGAAAINTGNNLLYLILGILLGFIVISGFLSDSGLWGITTEWLPTGSLYAGEAAIMECRLHKGWFPGVAVTVESRWHGLGARFSFAPWVAARSRLSLQIPVIPTARGRLILDACVYSTGFPFGLFQKSHTERMGEGWIVFPRVERLPWDFFKRLGQDPSRVSAARLGPGSLPFILRDYRLGDAIRQMHWKASAKRQRLIIKEMEAEASEGDLFYLGSWPASLGAAELERFISFIASLIFTVHERGRPVGLAAPERLFKPDNSRRQLHRIFEFLALVDPSKGAHAPAQPLPWDWNPNVMDIAPLWKTYGRSYGIKP